MVRRLGRRWQMLHRLVYAIGILGLIHYSMQSKLEQWEPTIADGIFVWLMGYRLLAARFAVRGQLGLGWIAGLGVVAATRKAAHGAPLQGCVVRIAAHARALLTSPESAMWQSS